MFHYYESDFLEDMDFSNFMISVRKFFPSNRKGIRYAVNGDDCYAEHKCFLLCVRRIRNSEGISVSKSVTIIRLSFDNNKEKMNCLKFIECLIDFLKNNNANYLVFIKNGIKKEIISTIPGPYQVNGEEAYILNF